MSREVPEFRAPTAPERVFNKVLGFLVGLGLSPRDYFLLQVRGRRTGRVHSTPVNVIDLRGRLYLVAPRGRTQWVRNAEAAGEVILRRGSSRRRFGARPIPTAERGEVLSAYLDRFRLTVQRYFPVPAGSRPEAFAAHLERYPVFELREA